MRISSLFTYKNPRSVNLPWILGAACLVALYSAFPNRSSAATVLFTNGIIHRVEGATLNQGQILVQNGLIDAVGPMIGAPADRTIDLEGAHVYPGLIAGTSSLGLVEINAVRATRDFREVGGYTPAVHGWDAFHVDSELLPVTRANGVTHALVVPSGGVVSGTSGMMRMDGWGLEEMLVKGPVALHVFWPRMSLDLRPKISLQDTDKWKAPAKQAEDRDKRLAELDRFFEDARAYMNWKKSAPEAEGTRRPSWDAMIPCLQGEMPVVIHANTYIDILTAIEWIQKQKLRGVIAGGRDAWRLADRLAKANIGVIYEATFEIPPRDVDDYATQFRAPSLLHKAGVQVAISLGLDSFETANTRNLPYHAAQAVAHGWTREAALEAMTRQPARLLGLDKQLGAILPGLEASFIICDGDILDIRTTVTACWIQGRPVNLSSRHTRLRDKYSRKPRKIQRPDSPPAKTETAAP